MRRTALSAALALAAGALLLFLLRDGPRTPSDSSPLRSAPAVPAPAVEGKVAYFYGLLRSGKTVAAKPLGAGGAPFDLAVWREIGAAALLGLGEPAIEYLTAPERREEYLAAPNVLVTVLDLLARAPASPRIFPFLEPWLDERNCPPAVPGSDWPEEIRLHVYGVLKTHPVPEALPTCLAELERPWRARDLRGAAIDILLRLDEGLVLNRIYAQLPPTAETPEPDMRAELLARLFQMAGGARTRAQVEELEPLLRRALLSPRAIERVGAMGTLHRLGRPGMEAELLAFFDANRDDEAIAWAALTLLATDRAVESVRSRCLEKIAKPDKGVGFGAASRLLAQWWPEEIAGRFLGWVKDGVIDPYFLLPLMLQADRERVVGWLREELRTADMAALLRALAFIGGEWVNELQPELLDLVRRLDPSNRPPVYRTLVSLRAPAVEPILLAELEAGLPDHLRSAAATELLNQGGERGAARIAQMLAAGDGAILDALFQRTRIGGIRGLPPALVPAVVRAVRTMSSEEGRRTALLILRYRGRFDDVRDGLLEAYRFEPSRRVAQEIEAAIDELAHR